MDFLENKPYSRRNIIKSNVVAATHLAYSVASAVLIVVASFTARTGLSSIFIPAFAAAVPAALPRCFQRTPSPSAFIRVSSETIAILDLFRLRYPQKLK